MEYKIVYQATDKLLKEALNLDKQVLAKMMLEILTLAKNGLKLKRISTPFWCMKIIA